MGPSGLLCYIIPRIECERASINPVPAARKIEVERRRVFITANLIVVQACRGEIGGCILRFWAVLGVDWCVTGFLAAYPGLGRILANLRLDILGHGKPGVAVGVALRVVPQVLRIGIDPVPQDATVLGPIAGAIDPGSVLINSYLEVPDIWDVALRVVLASGTSSDKIVEMGEFVQEDACRVVVLGQVRFLRRSGPVLDSD